MKTQHPGSRLALLIAISLALGASGSTVADTSKAESLPPAPEIASGYRTGMKPVHAVRHMAAAANPLATAAGQQMLRQGGTAIDAAVAMQAVLTLVEPQASGIGGGAFIMYWDGKNVRAYDGREAAPHGAKGDLFLNPDGSQMPSTQAQIGGRSVGVPGTLRALEMAQRRHGKLTWESLFEPAIRLARDGFPVSPRLHAQIAAAPYILRARQSWPSTS